MKFRDALERWLGKYDLLLYMALFLASLYLRLSTLSAPPLNESEALQAWGAFHLLHGTGTIGGSSALFASLTAGILFLAGPSHWAPRIVPALAGSLLVFLPLIFRSARGKLESALAAILIALSPSLWIVSTLAGGAALGLLAAAAWIFFLRGGQSRPLPGGLLLGLALAAGTVGWSGLAITVIVLAADWAWRRTRPGEDAESVPDPLMDSLAKIFHSPAGLAGLAVGVRGRQHGNVFLPARLGGARDGSNQLVCRVLLRMAQARGIHPAPRRL